MIRPTFDTEAQWPPGVGHALTKSMEQHLWGGGLEKKPLSFRRKKRDRSRKTARDCKYREALQSRRRRELWFTRNLISDSAWWPPDVGYALTKIQVCEKADAFVIQMSTAGTKMEKLGTAVSHTVKEEYLSPLPGRVPHSRGSKSRDMRNNRLGWHR